MHIRVLFAKVAKLACLLNTLNNPYFFLYRIFHYTNKFVPNSLAEFIYHRNLHDYRRSGIKDFLLETYDGSGQLVHPDFSYFNNQYWLVVTPYPYGMEEYENPCIYRGEDIMSLTSPNGPIAVPHKHSPGVHLSDPCFATNANSLLCFYRESECKGKEEEHKIYSIQYSELSNSWDNPKLIMCSVEDMILSPALVYNELDELMMYYVSTKGGGHSLVSSKITSDSMSQICHHTILGMPDGYDLWHIGISKLKDIDLSVSDADTLVALFLVKSKSKGGGMRLFEAVNNNFSANWEVSHEIELPTILRESVVVPYKSCYIPKHKNKILLGFRDKKSRNRMSIINNVK